MHTKMQMKKVFYSEHYYVDLLWDFDEVLKDGKPHTTLTISSSLVFVKNIPLVQKKIEDYYKTNLMWSFNEYLKPRLEVWIQNELLDKIKSSSSKEE